MDLENIFFEYTDLDIKGLELLNFDSDGILIPKKTEYTIKKYLSKKLLKDIDVDTNIAIEKCLILLSNFNSLFYTENKWKTLSSVVLESQIKKPNSDNTFTYNKILNALKIGTTKGSIIDVKTNELGNESFLEKVYSKQYKLSDLYLKAGLIRYEIKTEYLKSIKRCHFFSMLSSANNNIIASNLINTYSKLQLPSSGELLKIGKSLTKQKYTTKKSKILTVRNNHTDDYWVDVEGRSFVEDNIKIYEYLTENGYIIPVVSGTNNGNRIVDSFTLMPSWIRNQIKIDSEKTVEIDFKCLHPNIAINLYGGNRAYLTHKIISEKLGVDINIVKKEHLAFFNMEIWQMKKSKLYDYYKEYEPFMLKNILNDKATNGHKTTTEKMFKKETEIMTEIISRLNKIGIYVLYIYDALVVKNSEAEIVKSIMNNVILEKKVKTIAE